MIALRYLAMTRRQGRRGFLGWLFAVAGLSALYTSSYQSVSGAKAAAINNYPAALRRALNLQDLTSPAGYLSSTVFGIPLLILLTTYVISSAARSPAGDEESGGLDLILSYPFSRRQLVLVRAASLAISVTIIGAAVLVVTITLHRPAGLNIGVGELVATCIGVVLLGWCLGGLMLLISAATGSRSTTLGLGVTTALIAYLADSFLPLIDHLGWVRQISPYYWFSGGHPLSHGPSGWHCALSLILAGASTLIAMVTFERRDLRI